MNEVLTQIAKMTCKIEKSSGCAYLYRYFDELVALLDSHKNEELPPLALRDLKGLIQDMASESTYSNFASANWIRYSARSFYCADYLVRYLPERQQEFFYSYLNGIFAGLVESGVAPVIEKEVFEKYLKMNVTEDNRREMYDKLISKAAHEYDKSRLWSAEEASLACDYIRSIHRMIKAYVKQSRDYSMLKEWIPKFRIRHVIKYREGYPESTWYEHAGDMERDTVMRSLDKILQIQGHLYCLLYWHDPEELVRTQSLEDMIDMFEAFDDRMFDDILTDMAKLPYNGNVQKLLEHFADHYDRVTAGLATQLLGNYPTKNDQDAGRCAESDQS